MTEENRNKRIFNCLRCRDKNWLIECTCGFCNKIIFEKDVQGRPRRFVRGHDKKGKVDTYLRFKSGGYWRLHIPNYFNSDSNGNVIEHVYFYQEKQKLCMLKWGDVHHMDRNKDNNMVWNLQGMMSYQHRKLHMMGNRHKRKDMSGRICLICGSKTTYIQKGYNRPRWIRHEDGFICNKCYCRKKWREKQSLKKSL